MIEERGSDVDYSQEAKSELRVLTLVPALVISFMNVVLTSSIRYFTKFETVTDYNCALAIKMTITMLFNSALVLAWYIEMIGMDRLLLLIN